MGWTSLDTAMALTAALASMACAVPGVFLVLRRQSMMGDALSHTVLPGIVAAFLFAHWAKTVGWSEDATGHAILVTGAVIAGLLTAFLSESVQRFGGVESSAALGVVYTSLFALGLLMIRLFADSVHLDQECVLFGSVERVVLNTIPGTKIPWAMATSGVVLAVNLLLTAICFKELRVTTFDPELATSTGISAGAVNYSLMAVTSVTLVAAFESVGSILVITMLVAPAVTAYLLTRRLHTMLIVAVCLAGAGAVLGHTAAILVPVAVFQPLGFESVRDSSTAGMTAAVCGAFFCAALFFSPRQGVISGVFRKLQMGFRIACEDILGLLYRIDESPEAAALAGMTAAPLTLLHQSSLLQRVAVWRLSRLGFVAHISGEPKLTERGRSAAAKLVRSHRLWESYMARHFPLADDHLHETAHRVEHYLDEPLLTQIEDELEQPGRDPHGRSIPSSDAE